MGKEKIDALREVIRKYRDDGGSVEVYNEAQEELGNLLSIIAQTKAMLKDYEKDDEMPMGVWYELIDFSERDYGSSWGFYGYIDRVKVHSSGGLWSKINLAGNAAIRWKKEQIELMKKKEAEKCHCKYYHGQFKDKEGNRRCLDCKKLLEK